jgi:hypothetical protein
VKIVFSEAKRFVVLKIQWKTKKTHLISSPNAIQCYVLYLNIESKQVFVVGGPSKLARSEIDFFASD